MCLFAGVWRGTSLPNRHHPLSPSLRVSTAIPAEHLPVPPHWIALSLSLSPRATPRRISNLSCGRLYIRKHQTLSICAALMSPKPRALRNNSTPTSTPTPGGHDTCVQVNHAATTEICTDTGYLTPPSTPHTHTPREKHLTSANGFIS